MIDALIESWQTQIQAVMAGGAAGPVANAGQNLWAALASIMVIWWGAQTALRGRVELDELITLVFSLVMPWAMLQFYAASVPGLGFTTPEILTGMGGWLQGVIVADAVSRFDGGIAEVLTAVTAVLEADEEPSFWDRTVGALRLLYGLFTAGPPLAMLGLGVAIGGLIGAAQVIWAYVALAIALFLGPVFIPWLLVPGLSFLFWGWLRTVLTASLMGPIAAVIMRVLSEVGVQVTQNVVATINGGPSLADLFTQGVIVGGFAIASVLAALQMPALAQALVSGGMPDSGAMSAGRIVG